VTVPEGGVGKLEVGLRAGGKDTPLTIAGTGPPPAAPPQDLIIATIEPLVGDTVVDRAFPLTVVVNSRGLYDQSALPLPDEVIAVARHPGARLDGDLRRPATRNAVHRQADDPRDRRRRDRDPVPVRRRQLRGPGIGDHATVIEGGEVPAAPAPPCRAGPDEPPARGGASGGSRRSPVLGIGVVVVVLVLVARVLADL
jgi:hypothetical protein